MGNTKFIIKILFSSFLLLLFLIGMNFIYKEFLFEKDLQQYSPMIEEIRKVSEDKCDIVYVGESSNFTYRSDDIDKRRISYLINDFFPDLKVGDISKAATHAGMYYEYLRNIPEESTVKTVIVTLNLRSFNAQWIYSDLETPLIKSIILLKGYPPLYNRFLLSFKGYDIKTPQERQKQFKAQWRKDILKFPYSFPYKDVIQWDSAMAWTGIKNKDGTINYPLTELACHYIKAYAFQIDTFANPRIKDFDKIVLLAKKRNWNLVFNLMAENVEKADELVGKDLLFLMRENRDLLVKRYADKNVLVVDNLECVPDEEFTDRDWTTEHYAEKGRRIIAKNVADSIKSIYSQEYIDATVLWKNKSEFYNDCEGKVIWEQMKTRTSEKYFSGQKSSKTGGGSDHSITFSCIPEKLPDSLTVVQIQAYIYQEDENHNSNLVMEISYNDTVSDIKNIPVKTLIPATKEWNKIEHAFFLPEDFYNAENIKIYIHNTDSSFIFVDDIKITFKKDI